jgi:hypothetical protein
LFDTAIAWVKSAILNQIAKIKLLGSVFLKICDLKTLKKKKKCFPIISKGSAFLKTRDFKS